jgi:hypothetical protein
MEKNMTSNKKISYIEPMDAPEGLPCRFCDMPSNTGNLGPVVQDGTAVDGETRLFSHKRCLMTSGGLNPSLGSVMSNKMEEPENIWAFTAKNVLNVNKIDASDEETQDTLAKTLDVAPATTTNATQPYQGNGTGAPVMPDK